MFIMIDSRYFKKRGRIRYENRFFFGAFCIPPSPPLLLLPVSLPDIFFHPSSLMVEWGDGISPAKRGIEISDELSLLLMLQRSV